MAAHPVDDTLLRLAYARGPEKSICPSEAARELWPEDWRDHMDEIRGAAARLVDRGHLRCTQRGEPADPLTATGPIRLSRP